MQITASSAWIILAAAFGCALPSLAEDHEGVSSRGAELLAPFKRDLMQALRAGLTDGPVEAIRVCRLDAPEIALAHSGDGVRLGRASHRLRNPANASPAWVQPILDAYLANAEDRAPRVASLSGDRVGYVEPILVQPLCLTCHGDALTPEVSAEIEALYPDDRATGFAVGDLRGVFWLEFPAGS